MSPNRAVILTAQGPAGVAVIRAAGPATARFIAAHFTRALATPTPGNAAPPTIAPASTPGTLVGSTPAVLDTPEPKPSASVGRLAAIPPGRTRYGHLRDASGNVLDDVVIASPRHDVIDIHCHGGPWIVQRIADLLASAGFEIAASPRFASPSSQGPGSASSTRPSRDEPPADADPTPAYDYPALLDLLDGDDDFDREVAAALPYARTERATRLLCAQPEAWRRLLADPPPIRPASLVSPALRHLLHPPTVAIVGPPNVGKSTLANALFGQERSITADLPGTTRDWVGELADVDGLVVLLVDTPGQRLLDPLTGMPLTPDPVEAAAILQSAPIQRLADLALLVTEPATRPADLAPFAGLTSFFHVANKSDLGSPADLSSLPHPARVIATEAQGTRGLDDLRAAILDHFQIMLQSPAAPMVWTLRQRRLVDSLWPDAPPA